MYGHKIVQALKGRSYATIATASNPPQQAVLVNTRVYTPWKTQLYNEYSAVLSSNDVVLLLRHSNFPQSLLDKIRKDISSIVPKKSTSPTPTQSPSSVPPKFTIIRPGVFASSLRSKYGKDTSDRLKKLLGGSFALITSQTLNPPQLSQIIRTIDRAVPPTAPASTPPPRKPLSPDDLEEEAPKEKAPPSIELVGAFVEDRFVLVDGVKEIGKLPSLETLHAQLVGLISAPGSQLAGVLNAASGGDVLRTLQGYEKGLQEASPQSEEQRGEGFHGRSIGRTLTLSQFSLNSDYALCERSRTRFMVCLHTIITLFGPARLV